MKFSRPFVIGLAAVIGVCSIAYAGQVALLSGPQDPSQFNAAMNGVIVQGNAAWGTGGAGNLSTALIVPTVTSPVNAFVLTPGATGTDPTLFAGGSGSQDAGEGVSFGTVGTGNIKFFTETTNEQFVMNRVAATTSWPCTSATATNPVIFAPCGANSGTEIAVKGATQIAYLGGTSLGTSGIQINGVGSSVNFFSVSPAVASSPPTLAAGGTDTNIGMLVQPKGTGTITVNNATQVNGIILTPAPASAVPTITLGGSGSDANRDIGIAGVGTGLVELGQTVCTATGTSPQTCNGQRGTVTTGTLTTAGATAATFQINNSSVTTASNVMCTEQAYSGTLVTNGYPVIMGCTPGSGSFTVQIVNTHATNALNGTIKLAFLIAN